MEIYKINAEGKHLGRVASEAASVLIGKKTVTFARNTVADVRVEIENVSKMALTEKKLGGKKYTSYTGYPGGLKIASMKELAAKHGFAEVFRRAVKKMLPKNKLQAERIKRLIIKE